jgi:hypothetical protein
VPCKTNPVNFHKAHPENIALQSHLTLCKKHTVKINSLSRKIEIYKHFTIFSDLQAVFFGLFLEGKTKETGERRQKKTTI